MLIAFTGKKRSGKDTAAGMLAFEHDFERVAFAGTLKGMIKFLLMSAGVGEEEAESRVNGSEADKEEPLTVLQGKSARYAMQTLGTEWRDFLGKDLWSDIVRAKIAVTDDVVITDMRFLHEAELVEDHDGVKVRVVRPGTNSGDTHASEIEMEKIVVDFTIFNFGSLDQLQQAVLGMVNDLDGYKPLVS